MIRSLAWLPVLAVISFAAVPSSASTVAPRTQSREAGRMAWGSLLRAIFRGGASATARSTAALSAYEQRLMLQSLQSSRAATIQRLRTADPFFSGTDDALLNRYVLSGGRYLDDAQALRLNTLGVASSLEREAVRRSVQAEVEREIVILDAAGRPLTITTRIAVPQAQRAELHRLLDDVLDATPNSQLNNSAELRVALEAAVKKHPGTWNVNLTKGTVSRSFVHGGVHYKWQIPVYKVVKWTAIGGGSYHLLRRRGPWPDTSSSEPVPQRKGVGKVEHK